jgi:PAS domain S-box-containing protein
MSETISRRQWFTFVLGIILPTVLAVSVFVLAAYIIILPAFEKSFIDGKRDMIRELTTVSWSILVLYEQQERDGLLSRQEAQSKAIEEIEHLRYGEDLLDYFWISDLHPRLVMHPYSKELIGTDLSDFEDAGGKRLFMEINRAVAQEDSAFIDYIWNKKYDTPRDVPKLSYVKRFEPWGWVVGTGIFLDDIQTKIDEISSRLLRLSLIAASFSALLLTAVVLRSLATERRRRRAEIDLQQSRIKYKTLVETAVDPIMMLHNGTCIYANKGMETLLGYSVLELENINPTELFDPDSADGSGRNLLAKALHGYIPAGQHEVVLRTKQGESVPTLLSLSRKDLGTQKVIVLAAKDVSDTKLIEAQLDASRERYRVLTEHLDIGVFRTTSTAGFTILEANPVVAALFNYADPASLIGVDLLDLIEDDLTDGGIAEVIEADGVVKERGCRVKSTGSEPRTVSLSLVLATDERGRGLHCDCLAEDISRQQRNADARERLIVELQTSLLFMNQPVGGAVTTSFITCTPDTTVQDAARKMTENGSRFILVGDEQGRETGILTDSLLRRHVVALDLPVDTPVATLMSSPLLTISAESPVFEALALLHECSVDQIAVVDDNGRISGVIGSDDLLAMYRYGAPVIIEQIGRAVTVEEIGASQARIPRIIKALTDSGAHAVNINRVITAISDSVLERLMALALAELGPPPCSFAFVSLGSEGRSEQTLVTDQDNAIIYENVAADSDAAVHDYFLGLGKTVCTWLDQVGYAFCKGEVMAMNPRWCRPLATWQDYFSQWISESSPENLMEVSIFFDLRCMYGDRALTESLRTHILARTEKQKAFLYQMAQNTLLFKVPIDFFGKVAVESGGDHPHTFNIKHVMAQVVGFARIYAIYGALTSTNTLHRLDQLHHRKLIKKEVYEEVVEAYNFLMQLRLQHQVRRIDAGEPPDNHVDVRALSQMEKEMLEKVLGQINQLRKRISLIGHNEIYF